ncbi:hypothetical protein HXX76_011091 [Chlamydomonas incerta]|uniref:C-type lectin domain-containing protein n=1 Tax=Chlamydomonas incerta TaxID=51695 RepID=A0A835SLQ7_CHLIN|nr:hypothetical protein HXX76_011091 [Chlamydomonas incerta]|eukprot:KAG2429324.1 hypothetical protein HXX76_011091 [Chlamydomonas incerta]
MKYLICPAGQHLCRGFKYISNIYELRQAGPFEEVQTCCAGGCCGGICCPVTWRVLAVVLPHVDALLNNPPVSYQPVRRDITLPAELVSSAKAFAAQQLPAWLSRVSGGRLQAAVDVEVASGTVTSMFSMTSQYPVPAMGDDLVVAAARNRTYDLILTLFPSHLDPAAFQQQQQQMQQSNQLRDWMHVAGSCCWYFPNSNFLGPRIAYVSAGIGAPYLPSQFAGLKHALVGALAQFYSQGLAGTSVALPSLDAPGEHGYGYDPVTQSWDSWYGDFLTANIWTVKRGGNFGNEYAFAGLTAALIGFGTPSNPYQPWDPTTVPTPAALFAAVTGSAPQQQPQPRPAALAAVTSGGFVYEAFPFTALWDNAEHFCHDTRGGHLVSITSQAEADVVQQLASSNNMPTVWLGLRCVPRLGRLVRAVAGPLSRTDSERCTSDEEFLWSDGTPYNSSARRGYANWNGGTSYISNEPPWDLTIAGECARMISGSTPGGASSMQWASTACYMASGVVCKTPVAAAAGGGSGSPAAASSQQQCPAGQQLCVGGAGPGWPMAPLLQAGGGGGTCCPAGSSCCGGSCCPVQWRVLAVLVRATSCSYRQNSKSQTAAGDMSAEQAAAAAAYVRTLPELAKRLSGGLVTASVEVVEYTQVVRMYYSNDEYDVPILADANLLDVSSILVAAGNKAYDSVIGFYNAPIPQRRYSSSGSSAYPYPDFRWHPLPYWRQGLFNTRSDVDTDMLAYAFVGMLESYYSTMPGVKLPCQEDLAGPNDQHVDCIKAYGYSSSWRSWLEDFATGRVWSPVDGGRFLGLNATVYSFGTPTNPRLPTPWVPADSSSSSQLQPPAPSIPSRPPPPPPPPPPPAASQQQCAAGKVLCGETRGPWMVQLPPWSAENPLVTPRPPVCCDVGMCCGVKCCPITWKVLTVIIPSVNMYYTRINSSGHIIARMTDAVIANTISYANTLPDILERRLSNGWLSATVDVEVAPTTLTSMTYVDGPGPGWYAAASDTQQIVTAAARGRTYDAVMVLYPVDFKLVNDSATNISTLAFQADAWGRGGCCFRFSDWNYGAGYVSIRLPNWEDNLFSSNDEIVLAHEFGHVLEFFYRTQPGVVDTYLPASTNGVLVDPYGGYVHDQGNADFGMPFDSHWTWLQAIFSGRLWSRALQRYLGLNNVAYGWGTPSDRACLGTAKVDDEEELIAWRKSCLSRF